MALTRVCSLSLPAWLHPPTREEVHSDPEGGRGGLRVSPPRFPQSHNLLVERGWAPEGQQEVGYCMHRCSCQWWHLFKGFFFFFHVVIFISRTHCYLCLCSRGLWKSALHNAALFGSRKHVLCRIDQFFLHMERDVGFLLTCSSFVWWRFTWCKTEAVIPTLSMFLRRKMKRAIWFSRLKLQSIQYCFTALQGSQSAGCRTEILQGRSLRENHRGKQSTTTTALCESQPRATWQATLCHDLRSEAKPTS